MEFFNLAPTSSKPNLVTNEGLLSYDRTKQPQMLKSPTFWTDLAACAHETRNCNFLFLSTQAKLYLAL